MQHFNGQRTQGEGVPLVVVIEVLHLGGQGEELRASPVGVGLVDVDLYAGQGLHQVGHGGGVVVMAVGEEDVLHLALRLLHLVEDALPVVAGIDDGHQAALLILEKIAVGADGAHLHDRYLHGSLLLIPVPCQREW